MSSGSSDDNSTSMSMITECSIDKSAIVDNDKKMMRQLKRKLQKDRKIAKDKDLKLLDSKELKRKSIIEIHISNTRPLKKSVTTTRSKTPTTFKAQNINNRRERQPQFLRGTYFCNDEIKGMKEKEALTEAVEEAETETEKQFTREHQKESANKNAYSKKEEEAYERDDRALKDATIVQQQKLITNETVIKKINATENETLKKTVMSAGALLKESEMEAIEILAKINVSNLENKVDAHEIFEADQLKNKLCTIGKTSEIMSGEEEEEGSEFNAGHAAPGILTAEEQINDDKHRASCTTFLQHLPCFKLQQPLQSAESSGNVSNYNAGGSDGENVAASPTTLRIPKCRECRRRNVGPHTSSNDVYCRFYQFRRLEYNAIGELRVAGFPNPYTEPKQEDLNVWQPDENTVPTAGFMDIQVCRYILLHAGDQFCYLWRQEADAFKLHENPDDTIAWKKAVQGIREICDVCDTTLFNFHWTCNKCGFSVCLDCFKERKEQRRTRKSRDNSQRSRDEYHWLLCTDTLPVLKKHDLKELMLTQIIPGDSLNVLGQLMHDVRAIWQVPQVCGCLLSLEHVDDPDIMEIIQDLIKESQLKQQTSASSLATEETLRQQKRLEQLHAKKLEFARDHNIDYVPGRVWTKETLGKDYITTAFDDYKHINFLRKGLAGLRRFLPPRAMTLAHSTQLAPGVPHEWLCDGKLLRLTDAMNPDNRVLFQEVWRSGQPVMISEVARALNLDLWRPEAFCRDFGDKPNDLINCLNGNLVPNQPMRHFWEGFQCMHKRLRDSYGKPMLLKLKDWPPGDDFAEILPTRFADLMKGLPMPEYTLRTGNLNIASCLPKMFVPPDLGPKMYNAYGSAFHPDKGTTNLHLDISDAVNIMVYVGIPEDEDSKPQLAATQRAIARGGCEFLTRRRCQSSNVLPGALWHIFPARDADKIRDLLNRVTLEKGYRLEPDHDPIHDQNWYLDDKLRERLFREYGVEGYPIVQCLGDAVFIPAGAPHQVQNLHNCIKVAEDFVSPENITHCYHLTHEFRLLSHSHTNHEDKLQIKNIIYHAIKDCCTILTRALKERMEAEVAKLEAMQPK